MAKDRRLRLLQSTVLNGIDFVEVASDDQKTLRVHFITPNPVAGTITGIHVSGGVRVTTVRVLPIQEPAAWSLDGDGNPILTLRVAQPGDFSHYTLTIESARLDRWFATAQFSFKARCPSDLDCRNPVPACPSPDGDVPSINYLAKDYEGFRQALSDFSAVRYPNWKERSEADFGMVMLEALSALHDDFSYQQDRVAEESTLETAGEPRSLVRHARLVDYEPAPATVSQVWLHFTLGADGPIAAGVLLSATLPDGGTIHFETGSGLADTSSYPARVAWNEMTPYWFDDAERCLRTGATSAWLEGWGLQLTAGQQLLIETPGPTPADSARRQIVRLRSKDPVREIEDPLFSAQVTQIFWEAEDHLTEDRDLTLTTFRGNLVLATQGRRVTESFVIAPAPPGSPGLPLAVWRTGPNQSSVYHHTLGNYPLAWLPSGSEGPPLPEIQLSELRPMNLRRGWSWFRRLIDASEFDSAFTLDPLKFVTTGTLPGGRPMLDYGGGAGDTIRFGDGAFGDVPEPGTVFQVTYRVGGGVAGNVAPDSVWRIESSTTAIAAVNPFAGVGGAERETPLSIRRRAPQAFRAQQFRAVGREDYEAAVQTKPWVQRAHTVFRWTGSWPSVFTTPDPVGGGAVSVPQQVELVSLLNRYRMAGTESYLRSPRYAAIDLRITVCARCDAYRGDVHQEILDLLSTQRLRDGTPGFFHFERFTFGTPLRRSALEAAIQNAHGVAGVLSIRYRRRGYTPDFINLPVEVPIGQDEIITVENNPSFPERGALQIYVEGGK